jgi:hypothetical protein
MVNVEERLTRDGDDPRFSDLQLSAGSYAKRELWVRPTENNVAKLTPSFVWFRHRWRRRNVRLKSHSRTTRTIPSSNGFESGGRHFPARFFAPFRPANPKNQLSGERKGQTVNPLIQVTKTTAVLTTIALAILTGMVARAAQIGETVQVILNASERVIVPGAPITSSQPVEITHITLESGVWMISGQINFVAFGVPNGAVFWTGGNISLDEPSFLPSGTAMFQADKTLGGNPQRPMALVQRVVEVPDGQQVFLTAGNFSPALNVQAWGFITALKVRNHVQ